MSQFIENRVRIYFHFVVYISICFILCLPTNTWALSDKRLCGDAKCEKIISIGTGALNYYAPDKDFVSFQINSPIRILSKSAGSDTRLWGVEVKGRRGYVDKKFVRESKVLIKDNDLIEVDVPSPSKPPPSEQEPKPKPVEAIKPAEEQIILNASETLDIKTASSNENAATTTTSPLEVNVKVDQHVINTESTVTNIQEPVQTTPVKQKVELVDGTEIPIEDLTPNDGSPDTFKEPETNDKAKQVNDIPIGTMIDDNNEDEDFDYEEDEEDIHEDDTENIKEHTQDHTNTESVSIEINNDKITDIKSEEKNITENIVDQKKVESNENSLNQDEKDIDKNTLKSENSTTEPLSIEISIKETKETSTTLKETDSDAVEKQAEQLHISPNESATNHAKEVSTEQTVLNEELIPTQIAGEVTTPSTPISTENVAPIKTTQPVLKQEGIQSPEETTKNEEIIPTHIVGEVTTTATPISTDNVVPIETNQPILKQEEVESPAEATKVPFEVTQNVNGKISTEVKIENTIPTTISDEKTDDKQTNVIEEEENNTTDTKKDILNTLPLVPALNLKNEALEIPTPITNQPPIVAETNEVPKVQPNVNIQESVETLVVEEETKEEQIKIHEQSLQPDSQINEHTTAVPLMNLPGSISSLPPLFRQTTLSNNVDETTEETNQISSDHFENNGNLQSTTPSVEPEESLRPLVTEAHEYYTTPSPLSSSYQQLNSLENDETTISPQPKPQSDLNQFDENGKEGFVDNDLSSNSDVEVDDSLAVGSVESIQPINTPSSDPLALPSTSTPSSLDDVELVKEGDGLFATILGTVNSFLSNPHNHKEDHAAQQDLDNILYPDRKTEGSRYHEETFVRAESSKNNLLSFSLDNFVEVLALKLLDNSQLLLCVTIAAVSSLFFIFGYYCFCNSSNEGALLAKLNMLERALLATYKENSIFKHDLMATRNKLSSIEDNSFGSNEMVISLKKELDLELIEKSRLVEQIKNLEKDLVSAADAGLELNKYVSELLSNQNGDESIKDTIEELQRQLNEQDHTIKEINASLAEKSRENSELQFSLAEQNARLSSDLKILQQDNDELEVEKTNLQTKIEQLTKEFEKNLNNALESKNIEMQRLQNHILDINSKYEKEHSDLQTSLAKIEALEDCLKSLKKDSNTNVDELINAAKLRGELGALQKKYSTLKTQLNSELESKSLTEKQLKTITDEIEKLKKEYNQSEKDKLDAQTRLDVLSTYFKEKEAQLQKELNVKEAMWLKQQGENTGTVDKITGMQEEIQTLKSQNEELRAEIEAQVASHKAQTGILQNRVHEHYLAARQAERRCDEARNESAILRSQLTALATAGNGNDQGASSAVSDTAINSDNKDAPSPLPGSPFFPPPLPFLPPQAFLGPTHGYMGLPPPPPFLPPPEDLRPAPLGRMRSPTSRSGRYSPSEPPRRSGRYSPNDDYSDYDDDYYDDDYDDRLPHRRRRSWHRDTYSPPPRTYRSLSPAESRYNCADTETDYSPPASPRSDRMPTRPINEV